ncbi:hypothetical protein HX001_14365 [Empedobacter brevis]|uniref:YopX protein domain-containing protein n=1 Tax=Empedobacter brevis TaxID=247 RepID=A0AAJ1VAN9_9FLAO|nr:YopX family protein [Empedobacter brevis]MDM1073670.1 hypothetical protein [Empedobacter brevis]
MGEILLRSWNKNIGCFYYFKDGKYYADLEFKVEMYSEVFNWNNAEYFTGLLDKNGNKIFEGDKCKVTFYNHIEKNSELIMNVVFTDGGFALIKEGKITTESVIEDDRTFVPLYYSQRPNEIEIIGNIHEDGDK